MKVPVETYPLLALVTVVSTCGIAVAVSTFRKDQGYVSELDLSTFNHMLTDSPRFSFAASFDAFQLD